MYEFGMLKQSGNWNISTAKNDDITMEKLEKYLKGE